MRCRASLADALVGTRIVSGDDVKAGDRYEPQNPGNPPPSGAERGSLRIAAACVEGRVLILATDPHTRDTTYALNLPAPVNQAVTYRLRGVEYALSEQGEGSKPIESGVWPSLDSAQFAADVERIAGKTPGSGSRRGSCSGRSSRFPGGGRSSSG